MRKFPLSTPLLALVALLSNALAIPQNFGGFGGGGGFFGAARPPVAIEDDMSRELIAKAVWQDGALPREWTEIPSLDGGMVKMLTVAPRLFGERPLAAFAHFDGTRLDSISALFLDAAHFVGDRTSRAEIKAQERAFKKRFETLHASLTTQLLLHGDKRRPEEARVGRTTFLRSEYLDYPAGDLVLRYSAVEGQSISVTILRRADAEKEHYLDSEVAALDRRDRREALLGRVLREDGGDTQLEGVPMFQQGQRPYCAVSTLGMATHYLGLRLGSDALAAGARFRSGSSAKGAKILELYKAAAEEADASIQRGGSFDFDRAQKAIDKGFPIVVWRRYSSERNRLHSAAARGASLPEIDADDQKSWPTSKDEPGHASVVTGYNAETREVIFAESWGEHARGKRMRAEELEATSYAVFYFKI